MLLLAEMTKVGLNGMARIYFPTKGEVQVSLITNVLYRRVDISNKVLPALNNYDRVSKTNFRGPREKDDSRG
jgi:hypothetical protein